MGASAYDGDSNAMSDNKAKITVSPTSTRNAKPVKPDWADGLRQLYDNVVAEPLPDAFADLLSKLDAKP